MSAHRASLLACLLVVSNFALADPGEVSTSFSGSLATANASGESKGGGFCFDFDTFNAAKLEKEIDAQAYVAQLDQQLQSVPVAPGRHAIAGRISAIRVDICWPNVGFENTNKIKGTVSLSVAWKVDGVEIATAATHTLAKSGPGGLRGMLLAAYAENLRQLLGNPALASALATPENVLAPVAEVVPDPARPPPALPVAASQSRAPLLRPKPGATSSEIAIWFIRVLDSGNWAMAAAEVGVQPDQAEKTWNNWRSLRGSDPDWAGPASVEPIHHKNGQLAFERVVVPIVKTNGHMVIELQVSGGKVNAINLVPNYSLYGPYAEVTNRSHTWPEGSTSSWYISPSGRSVVYEVRGPTGALAQMQLIKSVGNGSLVMLRSTGCPDNVCGQAGTLKDGIVSWREPKASGGYSGGYMDVKVWVENNALVSFTTDPAPYSGVQIYDQYPEYEYLRPKPMPVDLQPAVAYTPEQVAESRNKIAALEPLIELEVAKAMGQQAAIGQKFADERERRQRSSERVRSFNRAMESMNGVLTEANEVATENAARSTAELEATIARMNAQAAQQAQQQRASQSARQQPASVSSPQQAQLEAAASLPAPTPSQSAARQSPGNAGSSPAESKTSGGAMTFLMQVSVDAIINRMNGTCYSNLITIPGPPGWPVLDHTNDRQAAALVDAYKAGFLAKCGQAGPVRSGNFSYIWNARGSEGRLADEFARQQRNRMFQVQVSP